MLAAAIGGVALYLVSLGPLLLLLAAAKSPASIIVVVSMPAIHVSRVIPNSAAEAYDRYLDWWSPMTFANAYLEYRVEWMPRKRRRD